MRLLLVGFVSLALVEPTAAAPAARLPGEVKRYVAELDRSCRRNGSTPAEHPQLVRSVDLTSDAIPDYVIDVGRYQCIGSLSLFYGAHVGNPVVIFVGSRGRTVRKAYESYAYRVFLEPSGQLPRVHLVVAALACGQKLEANTPFSDWEFCSRPLDWNAEKGTFVVAPLEQARPYKAAQP